MVVVVRNLESQRLLQEVLQLPKVSLLVTCGRWGWHWPPSIPGEEDTTQEHQYVCISDQVAGSFLIHQWSIMYISGRENNDWLLWKIRKRNKNLQTNCKSAKRGNHQENIMASLQHLSPLVIYDVYISKKIMASLNNDRWYHIHIMVKMEHMWTPNVWTNPGWPDIFSAWTSVHLAKLCFMIIHI